MPRLWSELRWPLGDVDSEGFGEPLFRVGLAVFADPLQRGFIANNGSEVQIQLLLAAAVKHSPLLGDFMRNVYAMRQRKLEPTVDPHDWSDFLAECTLHYPAIANWTDATRAKLFQVIVRVLVEAKYLDNARSLRLTPKSLNPDVRRYLADRHETYALDCLERAQ